MNKAHTNTNWEDFPSTNTAVNAHNLNKMDGSIDIIDDRVLSLDTTKFDKSEAQGLFKDVSLDRTTGIISFTMVSGATKTIDTLLEKIAINFDYDPVTQRLIITLDDGTVKYIDLSALITQYEFLDSNTVAFSVNNEGKVTAIVKEGSIEEKHLRPNYLADVKIEVAKAQASQQAAADKASEAMQYAKESQSYAVGTGNARPNEGTDNAKTYYELSKEIADNLAQGGTVTGVKGEAEGRYRAGNVSLSPTDIGALALTGGTVAGDINVMGDVTTGSGFSLNSTTGFCQISAGTLEEFCEIFTSKPSGTVFRFKDIGGVFFGVGQWATLVVFYQNKYDNPYGSMNLNAFGFRSDENPKPMKISIYGDKSNGVRHNITDLVEQDNSFWNADINFNDMLKSGFYRLGTNLENGPDGDYRWGQAVIIRGLDTFAQMAFSSTKDRMAFRAGGTENITGSLWHEVATTTESDTQVWPRWGNKVVAINYSKMINNEILFDVVMKYLNPGTQWIMKLKPGGEIKMAFGEVFWYRGVYDETQEVPFMGLQNATEMGIATHFVEGGNIGDGVNVAVINGCGPAEVIQNARFVGRIKVFFA